MRKRLLTAGMSVLEVLVAFTVLTVAILALMGLLPAAAKQQTSSDNQNRALNLAKEYMDRLLQDPANITDPDIPATAANPFAISWPKTIPNDPNNSGCGVVTVEVTWLESSGAHVPRASQVAANGTLQNPTYGERIRRVTLRSLVKTI